MPVYMRIVDEDSERFNQVGLFLGTSVVPTSTPPLNMHRVKFEDGAEQEFMSYQVIQVLENK